MDFVKEKSKKRIGILRGGAGEQYHSSLKKGGELIAYIFENLSDSYKPVDILVDKDYLWHINGIPVAAGEVKDHVDVVWNTSHPTFSNILDSFSVPNIGTPHIHSRIENNNGELRAHIKKMGLDMPKSILFPVYQEDFDGDRSTYAARKAKQVFEKFGSPWIVKSFTEEKSMGIHLAKTFPELVNAIEDGVNHGKSIIVEEFIKGKIASVHTVPGFRNQDMYTFPLGNTYGTFSNEEKEKLINIAKELHEHLDAKHYLKSDFVLNKRGKVYLLNIESHLDFASHSHFSEVCESVGAKMHHVVEHMLEKANL